MAKTNLNSTVEAAEEKNKEVIREIIDPTPGLITNELFTENDQIRNQDEDEINFKLASDTQAVLDNILNSISSSTQLDQPIIEKVPNNNFDESQTEDLYIEDSYIENPLKEIQNYFPLPSTDTRKDFQVSFEDNDLEVNKTAITSKVIPKKKEKIY